ncbi:precorrin-6Y C5,15-methyltransferase (decarboxylating) subunit CbiT [Gudongella sp. SC589]|uniref:precorrin-6Y C5,15-methyltransferase (decarboxylating) subunit CbiT n=1 Tax=Gudongella sp. SC589 TaxID=3385990 RepID=UPI003904CFAE
MTKFVTRTLVIGLLEIKEGELFLDIGAGTGSVSVQAALSGARVISIEREKDGISLIRENQDRFQVSLDLVQGEAPFNLPERVVDKCFIGGSGGKLEDIMDYLDRNLREDGILCAAFITLGNLNRFLQLLKLRRYRSVEARMVQATDINEAGILKGQNPVFIVRGVK